jgi:hypothetical protein
MVVFGRNLLLVDEWEMVVPFLTGIRPLTFENLWAVHNDHRIVLTRLIELSLVRLSGGDFRVGMYVNVAVCAAIAAALIRAARRLRGRPAYQDALFPLLLLQLGHHQTFLRGDTIGNVLATAFACALLLIILQGRAAAAPRRLGRGLPAAPAFLRRQWSRPHPRTLGLDHLCRHRRSPRPLPEWQSGGHAAIGPGCYLIYYNIFLYRRLS